MKVVIINKSDATGGAAVVSRRLMEALRAEGVDARMLVCEKLTDSPYVHLAASPWQIKRAFLEERLKIFMANGFNRATLFKIDTGKEGLALWNHPLVKSADAVLLNWVNQGMVSLNGVRRILNLGKPVIWTMHDMWEMTGICHHAGECEHFKKECGDCSLLIKKSSPGDLSHRIWGKKKKLYEGEGSGKLVFVAVSNWLKDKAKESSLLSGQRVEVIPNAFDLQSIHQEKKKVDGKIRILFGAARLDDPIKGLDTLKKTTQILVKDYPEMSANLELCMFGNVKDPASLQGFDVPLKYMGILRGEAEVRRAYESSDIVVSASSYETLPGTLVEAQAYGCIPVSFNRGGQRDIIEPGETGFIAKYEEDSQQRASNLAKGIALAYYIARDPVKFSAIREKMLQSVVSKFSYSGVAAKYISLIRSII